MTKKKLETIKQSLFVIGQINYKEHKRKTDETNLGFIWNILNPFLYMVIMSVYYQNIIHHKIENFPVFVFTGITMMNFYNSATNGAMHCLVSNKRLIVKTHLPMNLFILQKIINAFKEMVFSSMALIIIMFYFKIPITWRTIQIVPVLLLTICVVIGMGEILSVIYVYFADIDYLYSVFMTMMFFVSGVFIPINHLPEKIHTVLTYNPIFLSIYLTRNCLIYNIPSHWTAWVKLGLWAIGVSIVGYILFTSNKNKIVGKM